jgi:5-oxoprolinase (ATP-hydrolysing)
VSIEDGWRFWIDRGGTFTDCIGCDPGGRLHVVKVLSSDDAPIVAIRRILGLSDEAPIPPCEVRMGTTLATNALLERHGVSTTLVITHGFEDLPLIGDQTRPELFALRIDKPAPLAEVVVGVASRGTPDGRAHARATRDEVLESLQQAVRGGAPSVAVAVLHGTRAPELERELGAWAREAGASHVSLSHEVDAEQGLLARTETTVADAYLTPLLAEYVAKLERALPGSRVRIMQSSGALAEAAHFRGRNAVLSGPAGGAVALAWIARRAGLGRAIGFDMGGTSTDVCRFDGELERTYEARVAGVRLRAPTMAIHTVAAGGGSLCRTDGQRMRVGPESAGADPGPICYGRGGVEPTLTDVAVALGRLPADRFPFALDVESARQAFEAMALRLGRPAVEVAAGFFEIAVESMAEAIRRVTVSRGHDARDYALVVFGGAGGQHACAVARRLGIRRVLAHPLAGVLSALGMGVADVGWHAEADLSGRRLERGLLADVEATFAELTSQGRAQLGSDGTLRVIRRLDLRYLGTETGITLDIQPGDHEDSLATRFADRHREQFGYDRPAHPVVATTARVEVIRPAELPTFATTPPTTSVVLGKTRAWMAGRMLEDVPVVGRESLGREVAGPAIVLEDTGALVVEPGWVLRVDDEGLVELVDEGAPERVAVSVERDPVQLEVFANAFMSIAEQMGVVLQRTAVSTNIRERLDFSCAVFDAGGSLIANAPHIPVHLGAMGETVRAVLRAHPELAPGDVYVSNDPAAGGSHLPDVTVVSPVHDAAGTLLYVVASRGHHADVGGITPGSMPPFSSTLEDEGVVFRALRIVAAGRFDREGTLSVLRSGAHPARRPEENLADLEAQIAANQKGARLLLELTERYGADVVSAYMEHVQADAAARVESAIRSLPEGEHRFEDALDDGTPIRVTITVSGGRMHVDFEGTASELVGSNLNAPRAVTVAALLYVLRSLVGAPIPLNGGCLRPVTLHVPPGSLLDPAPERAIAGGNVETSQRVVDVLLGALGRVAASQGTMNNVTFGDDRFGYYETLAGGSGAGDGFDGASCVHTHMTNSRITDPEVLEDRFPVRLVRFARRHGSGGDGRYRGGDGVVREYELLAPLRFSVLSERRTLAPFGLAGGLPGQTGRNLHEGRAVGGKTVVEGRPGERVVIETPGGGGFGTPVVKTA